jgi:hypothetical protein
MTFHLNLKLNRRTITLSGISGLIVLFCIFSLPSFLAASLDAGRAEKEIRHYLRWQMSSQQMRDLQAAGLSLPNTEMAEKWKANLEYIDHLEFVSVKIGRFLFVPPFTSSRMFVVKVVLRDAKEQYESRYFSFSARSKFFDFFWVAEQSRWMWILSI